MANFIQYGDRRLDMGELTLDQAKALMARHFPELADPLIKTEKKNDDTIYTFTKKAGRKGAPGGAPSPLAITFEQLAALKETPIVPDGLLAVLFFGEDAAGVEPESLSYAEHGIEREIVQVQRFTQALADVPALATGGTVL